MYSLKMATAIEPISTFDFADRSKSNAFWGYSKYIYSSQVNTSIVKLFD